MNVYANQVHTRTRHSRYQPQRAIVAVTLVNFVQRPAPILVVWNRGKRKAINTKTLNGVQWYEINIGANMTHMFKSEQTA